MTRQENFGGVDWTRLIAAYLVIAIHTSPLQDINPAADFLFSRVLARLAVPLFFCATGYFFYTPNKREQSLRLGKKERRLWLFYLAAILLYLPLSIYAGYFDGLTPGGALRLFLFDGTFYHLWYLPAAAMGLLFVYVLEYLPGWLSGFLCLFLYLVGLLGDSWSVLAAQVPALGWLPQLVFTFSDYTRILMALPFLSMGTVLRRRPPSLSTGVYAAGWLLSTLAMCAEGLLLYHAAPMRHDSMYVFLLPASWFLFRFVSSLSLPSSKTLREFSALLYLLHPLCIVAVRGVAKWIGAENLLVQNSLGHFFAVCLLSSLVSLVLLWGKAFLCAKSCPTGRAWAEISRESLLHNVKVLRQKLPEGCALMPAVKANAYGHGAVLVAKTLRKSGVRAFCVASAEEGAQLRRGGIRGEILVLGYTAPENFSLLRRYRLSQTVMDTSYAALLDRWAGFGKCRVHIKVDTGMHRLGMDAADVDAVAAVFGYRHLQVGGIFSHFCADATGSERDRDFTALQTARFQTLLSALEERGVALPKIHMAASGALLHQIEVTGDWARVGIALYGLLETKEETDACARQLQPVLTLKARVAQVRPIKAGESAGYDLAFTAQRDTKLAVLTIGYGDGVPRNLSQRGGEVLFGGKRAPMVGRICMDQLLVDATDLPDLRQGDTVILLGQDGSEQITAADWAEQTGTITNEILSRLGARIRRILV